MSRLPSENALPRICCPSRGSTGPASTMTSMSQSNAVRAEAILFDAGDILYDATAWWRWVVKLLSRFDVHTHFDASYHLWQREYLEKVRRGCTDYWTAFADFLRSLGMRPAQIQETLAASQPRYQQLHDRIRPLPEVTTTLAKLSAAGFRLGVANHAVLDGVAMRRRLKDAGLDRFFDFVGSTGDTRLLVPTVAFYQRAARQLSECLDVVAFVGHDVEELQLAKAAGMRTIACNHRRGVDVDVAVDRFARLPEVILPIRTLRRVG